MSAVPEYKPYDKEKILEKLEPKFNDDKVILNYLYNKKNDNELRELCYEIIYNVLETGNKSFDYDGRYVSVSNQKFKGNRIDRIIEYDNELNILYQDGPVSKLYKIKDLNIDELYDMTKKLMDKCIEGLKISIQAHYEYLREKEIEDYKNWFYSHY